MSPQYSFAQTGDDDPKIICSSFAPENEILGVLKENLAVSKEIRDQNRKNAGQLNPKILNTIKGSLSVQKEVLETQRILIKQNDKNWFLGRTAERGFFSTAAPYYSGQILMHIIGDDLFIACPPLGVVLWSITFTAFLAYANKDYVIKFKNVAKDILIPSQKKEIIVPKIINIKNAGNRSLSVRKTTGRRFQEIKKTWEKNL